MKNNLNNLELLNNLSDLYFEVLLNDKEELNEFLKEEKLNIHELDRETDELINKLKRNALILINKKLKSEQNLYKKAMEYLNSLPSIDEFINSMSKEEKDSLLLAFRNANKEGKTNSELKRDLVLLKIMEDLKKENE